MMEEETAVGDVVPPPKEKLFSKKNLFLLVTMGYANFMLGTCYSLPAPFFPREAEEKGASPTVYGLVFGAFQFVNLIMSPTWGKLMPYLVPRFVMVAGMFVAGSCSVLFGVLEFCPPGTPYIVLSFLVRIVESIGVTAYITTCYGMMPLLFPDNVATVLATMETLFGFGLIAGPTLGGALYQVGGYYLPFVVMGGCLIVGTVFTSISFSGKDEPPQGKTGSFLELLASPGMIIDCIIFTLGPICIGFNDATLEPHLRQFHLTPAVLGSVFIILGGIYAFISPVYGFLIDKGVVSPHVLCLLGSFFCLVSFLIIGPVPFLPFETSLTVIIVALVIQGFGIGAQIFSGFVHGMKDVIDRGLPDNVSTYALYTGVMMAFNSLGGFVGPSLGGFLLDHVGYKNGTIVIVGFEVFLIVVLVVYLITGISRRKSLSTRQVQSNTNKDASERTPLLTDTKSGTDIL